MAAPMAAAAAQGLLAAFGGANPPPPGGNPPGGGMQPRNAGIVAGIVASVLAILTYIGLGLWDAVGWGKGLIGFVLVGVLAFGVTFLICIRPPQPRQPAAPAPAPAATNHTFIAIMVGCGTTIVASIVAVVAVSRFSDDGAFRMLAFLAPYLIAGVIATRALFKRGS